MKPRDQRKMPINHLGPRCGFTGKRRYKTAAGALAAGRILLGSEKWKSNSVRAYSCIHCGGYHITST